MLDLWSLPPRVLRQPQNTMDSGIGKSHYSVPVTVEDAGSAPNRLVRNP